MTRNEIILALKNYFNIKELVCDHVYAKWGEQSWQFLDTDFLHCLLILRRDIFKRAMYCNGRSKHQRGLRCNRCDVVKTKKEVYLSSHIFGKAGDFDISGLTAEQARQMIKANAGLLPCNIRVEEGVSWLHIDCLNQYGITDKVYGFRS